MQPDEIYINDLLEAEFKDGGRGDGFFDCWGLVKETFHRFGTELPDYKIHCHAAGEINAAIDGNRGGWQEIPKEEIENHVPCLVVMRFNQAHFCNHVGVYLGNRRFIHIAEKMGVGLDSIDMPYWKRKIEGFYIRKGE